MKCKQLLTLMLAMFFIVGSVSGTALATEKKLYTSVIPAEMQPCSVIEYIDSSNFIILEGGMTIKQSKIVMSETHDELLAQTKLNGSYYIAIREELPTPVKGVKVFYGTDGFINDIVFPEGVVNPLLQPVPQSTIDNIIKSSTPIMVGCINGNENSTMAVTPTKVLIASWGSHNNQLYSVTYSATEGGIYGTGRATTFSDTIGQGNITNTKGSIATKLAYDNCALNKQIPVTATKKAGGTLKVTMKKTDAGTLPDAVIDIWKTGVEYWGYTWSSNFSMPGTTTYDWRFPMGPVV